MHLAIAPDRQPQPLRQRVDTRHTDAMQAARDLVAVLVELAAGMKLGQGDLCGRSLGFVLVVEFDAGRDAAPVVDDRDRIVGMDRDDDVVAVSRQRLVDRVVDDLEHHVVQARSVLGVTDVHPRSLAHGLQSLEDLDAAGAVVGSGVAAAVIRLVHRGLIRDC